MLTLLITDACCVAIFFVMKHTYILQPIIREEINQQGPYAPTGGLDKPLRYRGVNLKNEIPRMHHEGVNVARG